MMFAKKFRFLHYLLPCVLVLIFFSLSGRSFRRAPWHEEALWNLLSPPQRVLSLIGSGISGVWRHYFALVGVQGENDLLKAKVSELEAKLIESDEVRKENERLKSLLDWHEAISRKTLVARVVANDPRAEFKNITISRGEKDGVGVLAPVMGPKGLVGKVARTAAHTSRVILITDPNSAVDAIVQRSRTRGMVVGSAWHTELKPGFYLTRLEYLKGTSDIEEGDIVVTSGLDGVFPPGIPIGTAHDIRLSRYGVFREANVIPFENMAEAQEVLVLLAH